MAHVGEWHKLTVTYYPADEEYDEDSDIEVEHLPECPFEDCKAFDDSSVFRSWDCSLGQEITYNGYESFYEADHWDSGTYRCRLHISDGTYWDPGDVEITVEVERLS